MLNSKPIAGGKYHQGLYVPENKDKVIKLNDMGGLYYRSGLERKVMVYLDHNKSILSWGAEIVTIPYKLTEWNQKMKETEITEHRYFVDFYYEQLLGDGKIQKVLVEVKPMSECVPPTKPKNDTVKSLNNFQYALKMYNKNMAKWNEAVSYATYRDMKFVILTEKIIDKLIK